MNNELKKDDTNMDKINTENSLLPNIFNSEYKLYRVVLEDILIDPRYQTEGANRTLSIPFNGKIRPVWAPNGYGKTFAFKILSLLSNSINEGNWNEVKKFFKLCYNQIYEDSKSEFVDNFTKLSKKSSQNEVEKIIIPFKKILLRIVDTKHTEVIDISIKPDWDICSSESADDNTPFPGNTEIKRKFWNTS